MVKIKVLGACQEVGRSGCLIESEDTGEAVLCDYGSKMGEGQQFPEHVSGKNLSALVLTHSHVDHIGGSPLFYISGSLPLYCTELTFRISEILLKDMLRLSSGYLPFEQQEVFKMGRYATFLDYKQKRKVGKNCYITLYNAGHIPGSAMVLVEIDGKRILYTGDINTTTTQLVSAMNPSEIPPIDAVVTETTYGTTDHEPRSQIEDAFLKHVTETLDNDGKILVPAFGVSRSQEILMVLYRNGKLKSPVTVDGMARMVSFLYKKHPKMLANAKSYNYALDHAHFINQRKSRYERNKAVSKSGVVVAPSGMLKGGTARYYIEEIMDDSKNAVDLVSYQVEDTPGRELIETKKYLRNDADESEEVQCNVNHFKFSSHSGKSDLINFLDKLKFTGEKRVICVHGDKETMISFAESIRVKGYIAEIPVPGQTYVV